MAKIFWVAEKSGDYMEISAFNNKRKAEEKALELAPHFSFGDTEIPKVEDNEDGDEWLYSGTINAKNYFVLYRGSGMPHAYGDFTDEAQVRSWVENEGYDTGGACFPVKLKGGMGEVYLSSEAEANGSELFVFEDGEVYESNKNNKTMKYVPTFESFIGGSQKVNENITMMEPFFEYGWSDEYDNKYAPLMSALRASALDDCVILGEDMPEFLEDEKVIKSFDMEGLEKGTDDIELDPHGDCEFELYKHNGMLIGMFYAEGHFSATICHAKDAKKWEKYFKQNDAEDYLY